MNEHNKDRNSERANESWAHHVDNTIHQIDYAAGAK